MELQQTQQALPTGAWDHETQKVIANSDARFEELALSDAMRAALATVQS